jgi:hypothetical protein
VVRQRRLLRPLEHLRQVTEKMVSVAVEGDQGAKAPDVSGETEVRIAVQNL